MTLLLTILMARFAFFHILLCIRQLNCNKKNCLRCWYCTRFDLFKKWSEVTFAISVKYAPETKF